MQTDQEETARARRRFEANESWGWATDYRRDGEGYSHLLTQQAWLNFLRGWMDSVNEERTGKDVSAR